jgi:Putative zinc-finger
MNCKQIKNDLSAYVDGELTAAHKAEIDAHLNGCFQCQARVAELRKLAEGVAALPQIQPAPQFLGDVKEKLRAGEIERVSWTDVLFRPFWLKVPVEALALIAVALTILTLTQPRAKHNAPQLAALRKAEPAKIAAAESYESAQAMTPPTPPGAQPPASVASPAQRADNSLTEQRVAAEPERSISEIAKQAPAENLGVYRSELNDGSFASATPMRALAAPKAPSTIVVSASDYRQVMAQAERVAAELGGSVLSHKPVEQTSANAGGPVTVAGSSAVGAEGAIDGRRFWVELPASRKDLFIAEFEGTVGKLELSSDLKAGREHALIPGALTSELKDQDTAGVANGRLAVLGVATNTQVFDRLQFEGGTGESLKPQEEPRLMLEVIVVSPTNAPAR